MSLYGIPRERVMGSTVAYRYAEGDDCGAIVQRADLDVVDIIVAIFCSTVRYLIQSGLRPAAPAPYSQLKVSLGRFRLLGLEILVAADIVRTVALEATLQSVLVLGLLVLIRTLLSWALVVEIEGRWPWQPQAER